MFAIAALGILSCSLVANAGKVTQKSATATSSPWASFIAEASQRFRVPAHWIRAVMQLESAGDTGALSPKGAIGLMQVMPETYAELRLRYHLGTDPYEPRNNILAGAAYLHEMRDRFGPDGFLAAYNAGPARYDDYLKRGRPLPEETRNYVAVLAPMIGLLGVPNHTASASTASQFTASGAAHDRGEHQRAPNQSKLNSEISQFDGRQNTRTMTLFAIVKAAFEPTSASAQTIDMTALEPSPARELNTTSTAADSLRIRTSPASRSSLAPSSDALFAGRSTHISK
ncbi:MAG TPA: lytic transglycosylase domain-containing protein [Methylocella sp.]